MPRPTRSTLLRAVAAAALAAPLGLVATSPAQAASNAEMMKEVVTRVNAERRKVGCAALRVSGTLQKAAVLHSYDMRTQDYFSHTSKDGRSPFDRMRDAGYPYGSAENIAAGQRTAKAVVTAWMNSSGHRKNILNCKNKAIGVGVSKGSGTYYIYWTQNFGTH